MQTRGFLPKFGVVVVDVHRELLDATAFVDHAWMPLSPAFINGIPVSIKEAEIVADVIKSANGELNAADFCLGKVKKAEKILKRLQN